MKTLAALFIVLVGLTISSQAQLPLGAVTAVTQITCPAEPVNSGWVSAKSGGPPVAICYTATITCPNLPDLGITYGVATPVGASNGTVVFVSPKGGTEPLGGNLGKNLPYQLYHANYQTVQMAWATDWRSGATGGGYFKSAACREATVLNYFNTTYYQTASNTATAGSCAIGYSGGAAGLGYSLTYYGAATYLDKATFVSGPHYGNLVDGCVPSSPPVSICPSSDGVNYPMGCNTLSGTWTEAGQYTGGAAKTLSTQIGDKPRCDVADHVYTSLDKAELIADSLVDQATDASYEYPQTVVSAYFCDDDQNWSNPSEVQGWLWLSQIASPSQVAAGCSYDNTLDPTACLAVNRVYGCQSLEAAYSGFVCVGNTCPVCTGNPPSCTCNGSACTGSFTEPIALNSELTSPVNGCVKRH